MTSERAKLSEQLRRYRALLGATADAGLRAALREMIERLETRLAQEEGGEHQVPPPSTKHPSR